MISLPKLRKLIEFIVIGALLDVGLTEIYLYLRVDDMPEYGIDSTHFIKRCENDKIIRTETLPGSHQCIILPDDEWRS